MSTAMSDIEAAAEALRALGGTEGGNRLAGQLSRLILVISNEATRTKRFRTDLLEALVPTSESRSGSATGDDASTALTRRELERLNKPQLKKLIDQEGMDPQRTIKSRTTKPEMIELIMDFRAAQGDGTRAVAEASTGVDQPPAGQPKRRRRPSPLDPYEVAGREGVEGLREELRRLDVEQLKDVIAEYGMNHDGRAMSWSDHHRFVERILEKTGFGTIQGNAFRAAR